MSDQVGIPEGSFRMRQLILGIHCTKINLKFRDVRPVPTIQILTASNTVLALILLVNVLVYFLPCMKNVTK